MSYTVITLAAGADSPTVLSFIDKDEAEKEYTTASRKGDWVVVLLYDRTADRRLIIDGMVRDAAVPAAIGFYATQRCVNQSFDNIYALVAGNQLPAHLAQVTTKFAQAMPMIASEQICFFTHSVFM